MKDFDDIRPYRDDEVRPTLDRLLGDKEFLDTVALFKSPKLGRIAKPVLRPLVRSALSKELSSVQDISSLQVLFERYMRKMLDKTATQLTVSGIDLLEGDKAYCFISNHRDIAMDPAMVNWQLYTHGFNTLRIAIGDNLLTKPFASDLMRLNKCFIVNRSAKAPREKFKAAKKLSAYIHHSLLYESSNVWIAQREGRAKDSIDRTNSAILSMLMLNKPKPIEFGDYLQSLKIVPVSISYENDPCDLAKAQELALTELHGEYQKQEHEDVQSIARGITGSKGAVHVTFGEVLDGHHQTVESVTQYLDEHIVQNYVLHPSNCVAYEMLYKKTPQLPVTAEGIPFDEYEADSARKAFKEKLSLCDSRWKDKLLAIYANPVAEKLKLIDADH